MKSIQVLIAVKNNETNSTIGQQVAGAIPRQETPKWIELSGESDEEIVNKIIMNVLGCYAQSTTDFDKKIIEYFNYFTKSKKDCNFNLH